MVHGLPCEICKKDDWTVLAEKIFSVNEIDSLDDFTRKIYQFVFEIWFPGKTEIRVKNLYCNHCGFICFSPRPAESELNLKYTRRDPVLKVGYRPQTNVAVADRRSGLMSEYIAKYVDLSRIRKVLDFGGSDGSLLKPYMAKGKDCFLIDYCSYCISGVTKLGNTVHDLKPEDTFDLIICSHVIEHVVSPVEILRSLSRHLSETGTLFVEVPMEIWKRPPLLNQKDPVTHINFFSPNSLKNAFLASGMTIVKCSFSEYLHASSSWNPGIRCLGRRADGVRASGLLKPDARRFLKPDIVSYFQFYRRNRHRLRKEILKRIGR